MSANLSNQNVSVPIEFKAYATGYAFSLNERKWVLDKSRTVCVGKVADMLSEPTRTGFIRTLAFYATEFAASHVEGVVNEMRNLLVFTEAKALSNIVMINYRASLTRKKEYKLALVRGFIKRWYRLGYPGVDEAIVRLLSGWRLKGASKGDAIKRMDPVQGPLNDDELQAFNEGAVKAFESNLIELSDLVVCLIISNTGRRPIQVSQLRIVDMLCGKNKKDEPFNILNIPRAKQGVGFRGRFKSFAISEDLWAILLVHARQSIKRVESSLGFELQEADRQQIPLFPDMEVIKSVSSIHEYRDLLETDKLHIVARGITDILQFVVRAADIKSSRTGGMLHVNSRRFRYTTGTRAAREGFGVLVIAELLDHSDTGNAGVYVKNIPDHVQHIDDAVELQLLPYAQAFSGVLVDSEIDAERGSDPESRIRADEGQGIGTCGEYGFCGASVPIPCYTCIHFQPWLEAPHVAVYMHLVNERTRLLDVTKDKEIAAILDRSIFAVAEVIQQCDQRFETLHAEGGFGNR